QILALVLFVCLHLSTSVPTDIDGSIEQNPKERFLFATKTVTNLVITTTTTSSLLRTWCYSIVSGIIPLTSEGLYSTQRKKRYAEDIVSYIGSSTYTAGPAGNCPARKRRWSFENPFEDELNLKLEPSSTLLEEVGNEGVSAVAQKSRKDEEEKLLSDSGKDARFGLSLIHTVTQTLTAVSKHITGTVTERVLLTCTPQNLGINSCGH
ncbi:hypothetical protein QYM36_019634, partial [Artemia franciscana]